MIVLYVLTFQKKSQLRWSNWLLLFLLPNIAWIAQKTQLGILTNRLIWLNSSCVELTTFANQMASDGDHVGPSSKFAASVPIISNDAQVSAILSFQLPVVARSISSSQFYFSSPFWVISNWWLSNRKVVLYKEPSRYGQNTHTDFCLL